MALSLLRFVMTTCSGSSTAILYAPILQHVPSSLWNEQLFQLVAACCVRPKSIGFSPADVDTLEKLRQDVSIYSCIQSTKLM